MKEKIAFIGMGIIGAPMTMNLLKAGFPVTVHTRTKSKAEPVLDAGAVWADTPAEAAKDADIVITCVTDTPDVEKVLLGENGVGFLSGSDFKLTLKSVFHEKTDIEEGYFTRVVRGNILPDQFDEMIALENTIHVLEFFRLDQDVKEPERFYKFKVFEKEGEAIAEARGYSGRDSSTQPREIIFADINSDGLNDLALLAHNHIVIYEQVSKKR